MTNQTAQCWTEMRTDETRSVEAIIREAGFEQVDAYRYNAASIRVRVIDPQFEGLSPEDRDAMVEPLLEQLPERTQADIMSLFTFAPSEIEHAQKISRHLPLNTEFEDPSPSML